MTDKFSHYFGVFVFVFSLTNVVRTVQVNRNTYNISFLKRVTRKFLEAGCSGAKQRQRNVQKKRAKLFLEGVYKEEGED